MIVVMSWSYQEKEDIISFEKEASGRCLFYQLYGVQVVGGSNPLTPTLNWKLSSQTTWVAQKPKVAKFGLGRPISTFEENRQPHYHHHYNPAD
jgi:hypothetical protein